MSSRETLSRRRFTATLAGAALFLAACSSSGNAADDAQRPQLGGDPDAVALALAILEPRAAALADIDYVSSVCYRQETVAETGAKHVSGGPLSLRRNPPSMLFQPASGARRLLILESATERLVLDTDRRHATRWTYETNTRCVAAIAALMLDLDVLARSFTVESVGPFEEHSDLTRITLVPVQQGGLSAIAKIEVVFAPDRDFPKGLRVISHDGGFIDYEIERVNLNPTWRDPRTHFRLAIPPDFKIAERKG